MEKEGLAVARQSQVSGGETFFAPGSRRLFDHWSFLNGTSKDELVPWIAVKPGFGNVLNSQQEISREGLTGWAFDGLPPILTEEAVSMLCCVEPVLSNGVRLYLLLVTEKKVFRGEVQVLAAAPHFPTRLDGLRPLEALQQKRIAIIGIGSGGSMVALNLAAAGVGTFHFFDRDDLTTDNLFRHACDLRHLGRAKVRAVRDLIHSHDLPAAIVPHKQDVVEESQDLWAAMSEVDLVLCATDNIPSRRLINYIAVKTATPLVMACTFRNAGIGEIIRVLPGQSACYECTRLALRKAGALEPVEGGDEAEATSVPYGLTERSSDSIERAVDQGTRSDVALVAALVSRVAIITLLAGGGESGDLPSNYLAWGGRAEPDLPDPFNFERPFSTNWAHIARRGDCPVCAGTENQRDAEVDEEYERIMANL